MVVIRYVPSAEVALPRCCCCCHRLLSWGEAKGLGGVESSYLCLDVAPGRALEKNMWRGKVRIFTKLGMEGVFLSSKEVREGDLFWGDRRPGGRFYFPPLFSARNLHRQRNKGLCRLQVRLSIFAAPLFPR